jgi:hypothetical protein
MGRSKKAYSLLRPNEHTPFFRVRWRGYKVAINPNLENGR